MKKVSEKKQADSHLIQVADTLIAGFKSPYLFLEFMGEAFSRAYKTRWKHAEYKDLDDHAFFLESIMRTVAIPWVKGGKDHKMKMEDGFEEIISMFGYEGFYSQVGNVIAGYGIIAFNGENGAYIPTIQLRYAEEIRTLIKVSSILNDYHRGREVDHQKASEKAA